MNMKKLIYWTGATLLAALTIASCAPKQNTLTSQEEAEAIYTSFVNIADIV